MPPVQPYHYGSHYSNSGTVLHFLVRMPPFTKMFLAYQGDSKEKLGKIQTSCLICSLNEFSKRELTAGPGLFNAG